MVRVALTCLVVIAAVAMPVAAADPVRAPALLALKSLERGLWDLKGADGGHRSICLGDPAVLLQLRHSQPGCTRLVIDNGPASATVHYTCPGIGHGRTTLVVETPRLLRLQTQGVDHGAPFDLEYEARRKGDCPTG